MDVKNTCAAWIRHAIVERPDAVVISAVSRKVDDEVGNRVADAVVAVTGIISNTVRETLKDDVG